MNTKLIFERGDCELWKNVNPDGPTTYTIQRSLKSPKGEFLALHSVTLGALDAGALLQVILTDVATPQPEDIPDYMGPLKGVEDEG